MIKIGLIDSGINKNHPYLEKKQIRDGIILRGDGPEDNIGHGSICASLIQQINPNVTIYNVKVFDKELKTSVKDLIKGIKWCINANVNIINISISTNNLKHYYEIFDICELAMRKNIVIVSSGGNMGNPALPAYIKNVIGVGCALNIINRDYYYVEDAPIHFYTNGHPLEEVSKTQNSSSVRNSSSFATANMTGIISLLLLKNPDLTPRKVILVLKKNAIKYNSNILILKYRKFNFSEALKPIKLKNIISDNINKIKMGYLISNNSFEKDLYKRHKSDLICDIEIVDIPNDSDSIIVDELEIRKKQLSDSNQNIFSNRLIKKKSANVYSQDYNLKYLKKISSKTNSNHLYKNNTPIITAINIGNYPFIFDLELNIRKRIKERDINIAHIGSYVLSEFFNCNFSMPDFKSLKKLPYETLLNLPKFFIETINNKDTYAAIMLGLNYYSAEDGESVFINRLLVNSINSDINIFIINDMDMYENIERCVDRINDPYSNTPFIFIKNNIKFDSIDSSTVYNQTVKISIEKYRDLFFHKIKKQIEDKYNTVVFDCNENNSLLIDYIIKNIL